MTKQALFYSEATPVNPKRHAATSVKAGQDFNFARAVNSVPLTAAEFAAAASEYPVVFAGEGDAVMPMAILGVDGSRNAFVAPDGAWEGEYVPAFIQRYPFVFSHETDDGQLILHVDEGFDGVNEEGRGERLFDSDGERTQYLTTVLSFLQEYQAQFERTRLYAQKLEKLGLLRDMQATFTLASGERRGLTGFRAVDRDRLKELESEQIMDLFATDELECTYLHLASIRHFGKVASRSAGAVESSADARLENAPSNETPAEPEPAPAEPEPIVTH